MPEPPSGNGAVEVTTGIAEDLVAVFRVVMFLSRECRPSVFWGLTRLSISRAKLSILARISKVGGLLAWSMLARISNVGGLLVPGW